MRKHLSFILALILTISAPVGCTNENAAVTTKGTTVVQTSTATTPETTAMSQPVTDPNAPYTPTEKEQELIELYYNGLCEYYDSDEYKEKYPVRSDLIWCDKRRTEDDDDDDEDYYRHPLIDLPNFDDDEIVPQLIRCNREYDVIGSPYRQCIKDDCCDRSLDHWDPTDNRTPSEIYSSLYASKAAYTNFLSDRKTAVVVNIVSDELTNATDKMEVLRAEEDYFESLGYEVLRNHKNYSGNTDGYDCRDSREFILVAMTKEQLDGLGKKFQARTPSTGYWAHTPCYSALGMYEE